MTLQQILPIAIPAIVILVLLRRARSARRVRVGLLWVAPLYVVLAIGAGLYFLPHPALTPVALAVFTAALALGTLTGVLRARGIALHHDAETGHIMSTTSSFAVVLLAGLIAVRYAASHYAIGLGRSVAPVAIDASMLFALAMVVAQRVQMWRRARMLGRSAGDQRAAA